MDKIGKLATKIVRLYDTVAAETNIIVKDKKGEYININLFLNLLAALWNQLTDEQKINISIPYAEAMIDFKADKYKIDKISKKYRKVPLLYMIMPAYNYSKDATIAYDTNTHEFSICRNPKANHNHYWYFHPTFHALNTVMSYLNTNNNMIRHKSNIIDFLLQNIEIEEIYLATSQDE